MCVPIYQRAECWTPSMKLVPYGLLPCPILEGNLAGRSQAFRLFLPRSREDTPCYIILFFSKVELKEKRSTDMSTTSSEPRLKVSGNSQWSVNGTKASPGPWKPLIAPLTLWPSEHSDTRCFKSTQRSYIKTSHHHHNLHSSILLSLPSCSGWGFEDIDSGTNFLTFLASSTLSIQDPIPKPKRWPRWNQVASLAPFLPLRLLSAGQWCPAPQEGW